MRRIATWCCLAGLAIAAYGQLPVASLDAAFSSYRPVFVNTHAHSSDSDAKGPGSSPREVVLANLDSLDGVCLTDHGEHLNQREWDAQGLLASSVCSDGRICLRGEEVTGTDDLTDWTSKNPAYQHGWGHVVVLGGDTFCGRHYFGDGKPPFLVPTYGSFLDWLGSQPDTLGIFAHPSLYMVEESFDGFAPPRTESDASHMVGCELFSHGLQEQGLGDGRDLRSSNEACYRRLLRAGWRVSPYNGGDRHLPPFGNVQTVTGLYVTDRTARGVMDAMRHRRTFATEQPGTTIRFLASCNQTEAIMGGSFQISAAVTDEICFHADCSAHTGTVRSISIVFVGPAAINDFEIRSHQLSQRSEHWGMLVPVRDLLDKRITAAYAKATTSEGKHLVSAPIWFNTR